MLLISETLPDPSPPGPVFPKIYPEIEQDVLTESEKFTEGQPYELFAHRRRCHGSARAKTVPASGR
jgi:hypothetical protein